MDREQPVLVGVGQVTHREGDAPEPVQLMAEAARRAEADSGGHGVLAAVRSVRVVNLLSRRYPDPGRLVADLLRLDAPHTLATTMGGQVPQQVLHRACDDIAAGRVDAVLVAGGESWRTRGRRKRRGEPSPWTDQDPGARPTESFGADLDMTSPAETSLGLTDPTQAYPMVELALQRRHRRTLAEQLDVAGRLWARFSVIAAGNGHAQLGEVHAAQALVTPSPGNRMVAFPYTKLLNSNSSVDQACALLVLSAGRARALGVPPDRWVFLHGGGECTETQYLSHRWELGAAPVIGFAARAALDLAGTAIEEVAHVDLYSCFPSAVQVAAEELGLGLERDLTVTGGHTFAGGPWNSYVLHSTANMASVLRADPTAYGLVSANGGLLTKHAVGVWSARQPPRGSRWRSAQDDHARSVPTRQVAQDHRGAADLDTFTVVHDRDGVAVKGWVFGLTDDGRRVLAVAEEPSVLTALEREGVTAGRRVTVRHGQVVDVVDGRGPAR